MVSSFMTPSTYQNISTLGQNMRVREGIADLRLRILEAQDQLASKKKASTHGGLGSQANLVQGMRAKVSMLDSYMNTASQIGTRVDAMQLSMDVIQKQGDSLSTRTLAALNKDAVIQLQQMPHEAAGALDSIISALNTNIEGRSLFAGDDIHVRPVLSKTLMLEGQGAKMGLTDVIALRGEADGTGATGRVSTTVAADTVTLTHDGGAFGMKLIDVQTSGGTVTGPTATATGATADIQVDPANMTAGDTVTLKFSLPDGSEKTITMIAASPKPADGALKAEKGEFYFEIGADPNATAGRLNSAIQGALEYVAHRDLAGSSASAAGNDFFDHNQPRIPDGPAATATGYKIDSAGVFDWYQGDEQRQVVDGIAAAPPALGAADAGQTYVAAGGAWGANDGKLATWNGTYWEYTTPEAGTEVVTGGQLYRHDGASFANVGPAPVERSGRDVVRGKIDDETWVSYGMRANEQPLRDSLKNVALLAATPLNKDDDSQYRFMAERAALDLGAARDAVIDERARTGVVQARVATTAALHKDVSYLTKEQINRVENIDEYDVAMALTDMMTQLQASYQVTSRLSQLSLTNFM